MHHRIVHQRMREVAPDVKLRGSSFYGHARAIITSGHPPLIIMKTIMQATIKSSVNGPAALAEVAKRKTFIVQATAGLADCQLAAR